MTAFDTDILSEYFAGNAGYAARILAIEPAERFIPVVVADEILRGWLNAIRQAEAGRGRRSLDEAFRLFGRHVGFVSAFPMLPYTATADAQFRRWRAAGIRIGTRDLRIAASCHDQGVKLATRNARDFTQVPGLNVEIWP